MGQVKPVFVIPPHTLEKLADADMCYMVIVTKEDEERVRKALKSHPEIDVAGYTDNFMCYFAKPGEVKFVGTLKKPRIQWEPRRNSAITEYIDRPVS